MLLVLESAHSVVHIAKYQYQPHLLEQSTVNLINMFIYTCSCCQSDHLAYIVLCLLLSSYQMIIQFMLLCINNNQLYTVIWLC